MHDPRGLLIGQPQPAPPVIIRHPETGEQFGIPQVALVAMTDNIAAALINGVTANVTLNVVSNVLRALKDKCAVCGTTRVCHNKSHDFAEPPPPQQAEPEEPHGENAAQES